MSYIKTVWQDYIAPALNSINLNKIEQGIYTNSNSIEDIVSGNTAVGLSELCNGLAPGASFPTNLGPIGCIMAYAGTTAPYGWDLCNGDPVIRESEYSSLFAIIGTTYGHGNGTTTFNLPDLRSAVVKGFDGTGEHDNDEADRPFGTTNESNVGSHRHLTLSAQSGGGTSGVKPDDDTAVAWQNTASNLPMEYGLVKPSSSTSDADIGLSSDVKDLVQTSTNMRNVSMNYIIRSY